MSTHCEAQQVPLQHVPLQHVSLPLHVTAPPQVCTHTPLWQIWPLAHGVPQAPQLALSVEGSKQSWLDPLGQQIASSAQELQQAPQSTTVARLAQRPPQQLSPFE